MNPTTTKITRSASATFTKLGLGIVAVALSWWLCRTIASGPVTVGIALIPGVVGLILLYLAFAGSGTTTCPACGASLSGLSTGTNDGVNCPNCHGYFEGKDRLLSKTDENRVADIPLFTTTLPAQFEFPPVCCVCGAPETHREKVTLSTQNASSAVTESTIGVTTSTTTSVEVPHCAEHKAGAALAGAQSHPRIRFRSYPYLRAFCQLNKTTPD